MVARLDMSFSMVQSIESAKDAMGSIFTSIEWTEVPSRCCEPMPGLKMADKISALWESFSAVSALMYLEIGIVNLFMTPELRAHSK